MSRSKLILVILSCALALGFLSSPLIQTNYDRIVLGEGNYGTDPNPTADITGQNDEYISNSTNGAWDFGSASLTTTGALDLSATSSKRDSFTTTAVKDTFVLTGLVVTDRIHIQQVTTLASATPDTGSQPYYAFFLNTDSGVVGRIAKPGGSTLKSAAIYDVTRFK